MFHGLKYLDISSVYTSWESQQSLSLTLWASVFGDWRGDDAVMEGQLTGQGLRSASSSCLRLAARYQQLLSGFSTLALDA